MMKKLFLLAVAGLVAGAASLTAQPPQGQSGPEGRPQRPPVLNPEEKTAQMAEQYGLTADQQKAVLELNQRYDGKLEFRPEGFGEGTERKDPRKMTDAEREEFFGQMQERMADMQERMQQMQKDQKAYDKELKEILDKDQFKAYRKEQRKREQEMQRMQQRMGGGMQGGFPGGPGGPGGFPGGPGGGFGGPGGGFGGPGGF